MTQVFSIDNGNSNPNIALFENGALVEILLKDAFLARYKTVPNDAAAIMADVGFANNLTEFFGAGLIRLGAYRKPQSFLDMPVNYALTLGEDRLALGYHAYKTMPDKLPALIIDSGTFTTIDVVNADGFAGGYIFPGVRRFYEIYGSSARLPNLSSADFTFDECLSLPHTTDEAILQAGRLYWRGVFKEIEALAGKDLKTVILTGGDALKLEHALKQIFANREIITDTRLMHLSLYTVYENIRGLAA